MGKNLFINQSTGKMIHLIGLTKQHCSVLFPDFFISSLQFYFHPQIFSSLLNSSISQFIQDIKQSQHAKGVLQRPESSQLLSLFSCIIGLPTSVLFDTGSIKLKSLDPVPAWLHVGPVSSAPSSLAALLRSPPKDQGPKRIKNV